MKSNSIQDIHGNTVTTKNDGKVIHVFLQLKDDEKEKNIGFITEDDQTFHITRKRDKHLFRKASAYGFNHMVLEKTKRFYNIRLTDEFNVWLIPVKFILGSGFFLNFLEQGFERQIFVTLEQLKKFIIKTNQ